MLNSFWHGLFSEAILILRSLYMINKWYINSKIQRCSASPYALQRYFFQQILHQKKTSPSFTSLGPAPRRHDSFSIQTTETPKELVHVDSWARNSGGLPFNHLKVYPKALGETRNITKGQFLGLIFPCNFRWFWWTRDSVTFRLVPNQCVRHRKYPWTPATSKSSPLKMVGVGSDEIADLLIFRGDVMLKLRGCSGCNSEKTSSHNQPVFDGWKGNSFRFLRVSCRTLTPALLISFESMMFRLSQGGGKV